MSQMAGRGTENDTGMARHDHADRDGRRPGATTRCACGAARAGLGNSALQAAGTPEQIEKWGSLTLAMAITEPGCGSDPSRGADHRGARRRRVGAQRREDLRDHRLPRRRRRGVGDARQERRPRRHQVVPGREGHARASSSPTRRRSSGSAPTTPPPTSSRTAASRAATCSAATRRSRSRSGGFSGVMKTFNMTRPMVAALGLGMAEAALDFTRD